MDEAIGPSLECFAALFVSILCLSPILGGGGALGRRPKSIKQKIKIQGHLLTQC